jgi:plasmid stabilization system protein ParE
MMPSPDRELFDKIAAEAEHAEAGRDVELPYRRRTGGTSPVYGLRLPAERIEQLRRIAEARGFRIPDSGFRPVPESVNTHGHP